MPCERREYSRRPSCRRAGPGTQGTRSDDPAPLANRSRGAAPSRRRAGPDFDSLREDPTENVDDDLRRRLGDVVWSIDLRAADGSVETMHVLIEHQSSVDYAMPLRFFNYRAEL